MMEEGILQTRRQTHGSWTDNARIQREFKEIIGKNNRLRLSDSQREALEMIAGKIARILSGDPNFADHWDDIAGYARLGKGETGE